MNIGGINTIDFSRVSKIPKFTINIKTGDNKRVIPLVLLENNIAINLNEYTVTVAAVKSDGNNIFNDVTIIDPLAGVCEVEVTEQMLATNLDLPCELILYGSDGTVASSSNFVISRISSVRNEESIASSSEFKALTRALSDVTYVKANIVNKRDKNIKITSSDLDTSSDSNKIGMNNLSNEVKAAMSGNASVSPIIPEGGITTENYADDSIVPSKIKSDVYRETSNYIFSVLDEEAYDVIERKTNPLTTTGQVPPVADDGTYTLPAGNYMSFIISLGGDLIPNKPLSIKMPVLTIPTRSEIITRWRNNSGYDSVKHKLSIVNGMGMISNLVYPEEATLIEILIDNRTGDDNIVFKMPSVITSGVPITTKTISLQDIEDAINIENYIVGGDGKLRIQEIKTQRHDNCTEVRAEDEYIQTDPDKGITILPHNTHGYLFYYYSATNNLSPGNCISVGMDIVEVSKSSTCIIRFFDSSNSQIGSSIVLPNVDNKFNKSGIYIPVNAVRFELRIDNRNENGTNLTINNLRIVKGNQLYGIHVPYPEVDFNNAKVSLNMFPDPECSSSGWVNFKLATPTYLNNEFGTKLIGEDRTTTCIGYETSNGFNIGDILPYEIYISEYSKPIETKECDFNIIFLDSSNNEVGRSSRSITKIGLYKGEIVIPEGTKIIRLRFDLAMNENYYTIRSVMLGGKKVSLNNVLTRGDIQGIIAGSGGRVMYVSPTGSDENNGTLQSPKATVDNALSNGADDIRVLGGVYEQTINLTLCKYKKLSITRHELNKDVTFVDPERIVCDTATLTSGYTKVYKANIEKNFSTNNRWLFQDGIADETTLITDEERHPLQRGYQYRCWDTKIEKCSATTLNAALQEIESATMFKWYAEDGILYFSRPAEVTSINPICYSSSKPLFTMSNGIELHINGIDSKYLIFNINSTVNSEVSNCRASNVCGAGAFTYNSALNPKFIKCEATRAFSGSNGDGFNGHASNSGDIHSKQMHTLFIDCWSHDNNDDGWSDHERSETTFIGGLFEYNKKGGITPSYGNHCTCYDVLSRQNYCGFNYVGDTDVAEGGMYGQMICYNCVAENNTHGGEKAGFNVNGIKNSLKLINCKSLNNSVGYKATRADNIVELIDCGSYQDNLVKGGYGAFIIKNTTVVV